MKKSQVQCQAVYNKLLVDDIPGGNIMFKSVRIILNM